MRLYGNVHGVFWDDEDIRLLSNPGKVLAVYLLTTSNANMLGCFKLRHGYVAEELNWKIEMVREAFQELIRINFILYDPAGWVWIRNYLNWNPLANPNQGKGIEKIFKQVPTRLFYYDTLVAALLVQKYIPEQFRNHLESILEVFRNQEQHRVKDDLPTSKIKDLHLNEGGRQKQTGKNDHNATNLGCVLSHHGLSVPGSQNQNRRGVIEPGAEDVMLRSKDDATTHYHLAKDSARNNHHTGKINEGQKDVLDRNENKESVSGTASRDQRLATDNLSKGSNKIYPPNKKVAIDAEQVIGIFDHWRLCMGQPQAKFDAHQRQLIVNALSQGYSYQELCQAINGCANTPYNMGCNDRGEVFNGLHVIFRSSSQINRFIQHFHSPPQIRSATVRHNMVVLKNWLAKKEGSG